MTNYFLTLKIYNYVFNYINALNTTANLIYRIAVSFLEYTS